MKNLKNLHATSKLPSSGASLTLAHIFSVSRAAGTAVTLTATLILGAPKSQAENFQKILDWQAPPNWTTESRTTEKFSGFKFTNGTSEVTCLGEIILESKSADEPEARLRKQIVTDLGRVKPVFLHDIKLTVRDNPGWVSEIEVPRQNGLKLREVIGVIRFPFGYVTFRVYSEKSPWDCFQKLKPQLATLKTK